MKLVVGNQKSYLTKDAVIDFIEKTNCVDCCNTIICPSFPFIDLFIEKSNYIVGAQNVSNKGLGASTGEISAEQLSGLNVQYCIVGHSERRQNQNEDSSLLLEKINKLLESDIRPILCIGEKLDEKQNNITKDVVGKQLMDIYSNLTIEQLSKIIIAYEPVWAIGSGLTPTNLEIEDTINYIKDLIKDKYDFDTLVLYGGSVSKKNIDELNTIDSVDGYLIGGSSTKCDEFLYIMSQCNNIR